ncbi:MFS transporter [Actinobacteria bacterium YIM 96077]|uniref:MFS transporter n=1 Tax=Phytoactinopolyspora halophila TaxID=1981511 RepID=A0A329R7C5_9ACTN|nr:MFS transporter [Actinobacteria bacterium YIM 96077]RAW18988.1 MFS transporter [Phytoactinopolyspora halophila]
MLDRAGRHRVLLTLCVTETVSYGVLYYAFPVLLTDIGAETGWSRTSLTAAFSVGLLLAAVLGIPAGRWLDRHGPRALMTAGSALAAPSVVLVALAPNVPVFTAGWILAGVSMAGVLYPPAFTAIARWYGAERVKALTLLTLAAGLASTIFAPLTAFLLEHLGWQDAYIALAAILAGITVPGHWWGLRGPWPAREASTHPVTTARSAEHEDTRLRPTDPARIARSVPFVMLVIAIALGSLTAFAVVINLVPMLVERGIDTGTASLALGLGGLGQVAGRLGYPLLTRRTGVRARTMLILLAVALTTILLGVLTAVVALIAASIVAGMARGLIPLLQATAVADRWGTAHYGRLTGILSAPITVTMALAPWSGSVTADIVGDYSTAFLVLAALGLISAAVALLSVPRGAPESEHRTSG